jgi:putative transcriptional regulator
MPEPRTPSPSGRAPAWRGRAGRRAGLALVWLAASLSLAAGGSPRAQAQPGSLAGQLLLASEDMPDARFARAVIFVVKHDATGAQGFVVNRPLREIPLAALMEQMGLPGEGVAGQVRLQAGGPVESFGIFALHTGEWSASGTRAVPGGFGVTTQVEILRALAESRGPRRVIFLLGYAGWAPGQLEAEMQSGHWLKAAADEAALFDTDHERKWERAKARQRIDL